MKILIHKDLAYQTPLPVDQLQPLPTVGDPVDMNAAPCNHPWRELVVLGDAHQEEGGAWVHVGELAQSDAGGGIVLLQIDHLHRGINMCITYFLIYLPAQWRP